jgi:hypothetical protein
MAIDIVGMLRGRKQARAAGIEELAKRLAAGEAVAPEEIEAILDRTGCDGEELQDRIDAIERRAELLAAVSRGNAAQAKIDKIDAEATAAWDAVAVAQRKHAAVVAKHADDRLALQHVVDAANRAHEALLDPANLSPADAGRLADARKAAGDAARAAEQARHGMRDLRMSLEHAEREHADAVEQARRYRGHPDAQDRKARSENAVNARTQRVKAAEAELPILQAAADKAQAAVEAIEAELRR